MMAATPSRRELRSEIRSSDSSTNDVSSISGGRGRQEPRACWFEATCDTAAGCRGVVMLPSWKPEPWGTLDHAASLWVTSDQPQRVRRISQLRACAPYRLLLRDQQYFYKFNIGRLLEAGRTNIWRKPVHTCELMHGTTFICAHERTRRANFV